MVRDSREDVIRLVFIHSFHLFFLHHGLVLVRGLVRVACLCVELMVAHSFLCCLMRAGLHVAANGSKRRLRIPTVFERNRVALSSSFAQG